MKPFKNVVHVGRVAKYEKDAFVSIEFDGKKLSITGVVGPKRGGDAYSCGQINLNDYEWDVAHIDTRKLQKVWDRWHLNNMRSGTPVQMECLRKHRVSGPFGQYDADCNTLRAHGLYEDQGYKYGSAWLYEEVPEDVLEYLKELKGGTKEPAWV